MTDARKREYQSWLQVRLTQEDKELLDRLTKIYALDKAKLVRYALREVEANLPTFEIAPDRAA